MRGVRSKRSTFWDPHSAKIESGYGPGLMKMWKRAMNEKGLSVCNIDSLATRRTAHV